MGLLSFFLSTEDLARKAHKALGENGVDACFYWFDNNWHYVKKWEHLKDLKSLGRLPAEVRSQLPDYHKADFSKSDAWLGRTISSLIKLSWSEDQVKERAENMVKAIKSVIG